MPRSPEDPPAGGPEISITPRADDPNVRRICVGDRVVAEISANDVDALGLSPGDPWTSALSARVDAIHAIAAARRDAFKFLAVRGRSRAEVIERLTRREHSDETARIVADELVEQGWLDDEAVAREAIAAILRKGPAAAGHLRQRLEARGIEPSVCARAADDALSGTDPVEAAMTIARGMLPAGDRAPADADRRGTADRTLVRRIAGALSRRGFDADTVATVLDRVGLARGAE